MRGGRLNVVLIIVPRRAGAHTPKCVTSQRVCFDISKKGCGARARVAIMPGFGRPPHLEGEAAGPL